MQVWSGTQVSFNSARGLLLFNQILRQVSVRLHTHKNYLLGGHSAVKKKPRRVLNRLKK